MASPTKPARSRRNTRPPDRLTARPPDRPATPDLTVGPGVRVVPGPVVEPWEGDRVEPWSRIRKLTADHMIMSRRVSAHVYSLIEVDYTRIAGLRAGKKAEYAGRGAHLTFLAFIASAVAKTLRGQIGRASCRERV